MLKFYFLILKAKMLLIQKCYCEIKKALRKFKNLESVELLIFYWRGNTFSSGADLKWMKKSKNLKF